MRGRRLILILILFFVWTASVVAKTNYQYSYIPKRVFATQVFPVTIFADTEDKDNPPSFIFDPQSDVQPIENKPTKGSNGNNIFYTFYFKAKTTDITIPELTITDSSDSTVLDGKYIPVHTLDTEEHSEFCGLIATSCKIITSQVSEFDAESNLVSMTIRAAEANPNEIRVNNSIESGIEKITRAGPDVIVEYYFVVPSSQKSVTLGYYNTLQNRFISKIISVDYKDKPVAAQENLNPKDSSFDKLKKYGLIFLTIFFSWMFWKKKDIFFLVLLSLCIIILFTIFTPHEKICIQQGAPIYILPTNTSTTSGQIDREMSTDVLNKKGKYYKIEYDHNIIGWIKDEDTCKN